MGGRVSVTCAEFANSGTDQSSDNNDEVSEIDRIVAKFLSLCLLIPLRGVTRPVGRPASPVVEFYSSKWPLPPSLPLARKQMPHPVIFDNYVDQPRSAFFLAVGRCVCGTTIQLERGGWDASPRLG